MGGAGRPGASRASVFIGSSSEGLEIAQALQACLDQFADSELWTQGTFLVGRGFLESLCDALPKHNFAVLVLTPDDLVTRREETNLGPRDNVLFELGLFMGALGRERTFMVSCADDQVQVPSDLAGIHQARFRRRSDGNLDAALGPVCRQLKAAMRAAGWSLA